LVNSLALETFQEKNFMRLIETAIPDVKLIEPKVFGDPRGFFFESYNDKVFNEHLGIRENFVQDNHSYSQQNVLRGLHYQIRNPQGKLVRVTSGEVFDVAVDLRKSSPTFGKWVGVYLNEQNKQMLCTWFCGAFSHRALSL
jgi:dTDP-4-dehydrorhamnose 3,5-epimerase